MQCVFWIMCKVAVYRMEMAKNKKQFNPEEQSAPDCVLEAHLQLVDRWGRGWREGSKLHQVLMTGTECPPGPMLPPGSVLHMHRRSNRRAQQRARGAGKIGAMAQIDNWGLPSPLKRCSNSSGEASETWHKDGWVLVHLVAPKLALGGVECGALTSCLSTSQRWCFQLCRQLPGSTWGRRPAGGQAQHPTHTGPGRWRAGYSH